MLGKVCPVTAYDKNGVRVLLHFASDCPPGRPDVLVVVASMLNTAPQPVRNVVLQAAVPKVKPALWLQREPFFKADVWLKWNWSGLLLLFNAHGCLLCHFSRQWKWDCSTSSGTELAPFNPVFPPAAITQVMLLANPLKVKLSMELLI